MHRVERRKSKRITRIIQSLLKWYGCVNYIIENYMGRKHMSNDEYSKVTDLARLETAAFLVRECESFDGYPLASQIKARMAELKSEITIKNPRADAGKSRKATERESLPGLAK